MSRYRPDLGETLAADTVRFSGSAAPVFGVVAVLAVAYPLAASVMHALSSATIGGTTLSLALRPFFEVVYTESLPFMIVAAGIGFFSPALGVLFLVVFVPADILAASTTTAELSVMYWQLPPAPFLARLASYLLLWILAVEIPIRVRLFAFDWATRRGELSPAISATAQLIGAAAAVFLWALAVPWLVKPVFTWSMLQVVNVTATDPTWFHWPILVVGVALIAGLAAIWPRVVIPKQVRDSSRDEVAVQVRSMAREVASQFVIALLLALLLAGLMTTLPEAVVLIAGLVVAGPILTLVLPRIPVPRALVSTPRSVRWVAGMAIGLATSWVILTLAGKGLFTTDYFVLALTLAIVVPLFRIILDVGTSRHDAADAAGPDRGVPTVIVSTIIVLASVVWLALPAVAFADDCRDSTQSELPSCGDAGVGAALGMAGGALGAAGAALSAQASRRRERRERDRLLGNMMLAKQFLEDQEITRGPGPRGPEENPKGPPENRQRTPRPPGTGPGAGP